jgi:hypothetical protein
MAVEMRAGKTLKLKFTETLDNTRRAYFAKKLLDASDEKAVLEYNHSIVRNALCRSLARIFRVTEKRKIQEGSEIHL